MRALQRAKWCLKIGTCAIVPFYDLVVVRAPHSRAKFMSFRTPLQIQCPHLDLPEHTLVTPQNGTLLSVKRTPPLQKSLEVRWAVHSCYTPAPPPGPMFVRIVQGGGGVDTTKTRSDPQRVGMYNGERPTGAAKGKQTNTMASHQTPPFQQKNTQREIPFCA